jgi:hypothetical protein
MATVKGQDPRVTARFDRMLAGEPNALVFDIENEPWAETTDWPKEWSRYVASKAGHRALDPQSPPPCQDTAQGAILPHSGS